MGICALEAEHEIARNDEPEFTLDERWQRAQTALGQFSLRDQQLLHQHCIVREPLAAMASNAQTSIRAVKIRLKQARDQTKRLHTRLEPSSV